jgi:DNA-binding transcriptional LysR family regulator
MKVSLRHFRIFVATAETGQISKAALMLFTSQPVVTEAIKTLEKEIGVKLFERHAKGVSLTSEGSVFLQHAHGVLAAAAEAMQAPHRIRQDMTGLLKLACSPTVVGYYLPPLLARFQRHYPGIHVELIELTHEQIETSLINGEIELAMCLYSPLKRLDQIDTLVLKQSKRRLWLPVNHPLLNKKCISLCDIQPEPYILLTIDDSERTTQGYWAAAGLSPNIIFRTTSVEATRSLVALGSGVTILSDMVYRPWSLENARLEAMTLSNPLPTMDISFAWKRDIKVSRHALAFVDTCRATCEN